MIEANLRSFLLLFFILTEVSSHSGFLSRIPNGMLVPDPCKANTFWKGVGHLNAAGGGPTNTFGQDFQKQNRTWTKAFCLMDSDQDGKTNGEELGDPSCTWVVGGTPNRTERITHPGVCDPWESEHCRRLNSSQSVSCDAKEFVCNATKDAEVRNVTLRFPPTKVPKQVTTYYCMNYDLPSDHQYHLIATQPLIDNVHIVHRITLFGCPEGVNINASTSPYTCGMEAAGPCSSVIGGWTLGSPGQCLQDEVGFLLGSTGYTKAILQIHWNNPDLIDNYTDASGVKLFYTPKLRNYSAETFTVGQMVLEIPPAQTAVTVTADCPSRCTRYHFNQTAYVVSAYNNMHYLGISMQVGLYRNGTLIAELTNDQAYSYNSPVEHTHNPPIPVLPGDEFRTTCVYNSLSRNGTVFFGLGTQDEICFGLIIVYPREAIAQPDHKACVNFRTVPTCDMFQGTPIQECDWQQYLNYSNSESQARSISLKNNCNVYGPCRPECLAFVKELQKSPCLQGEAWKFIADRLLNTYEGMQELFRINSCLVSDIPATASTTSRLTTACAADGHTGYAITHYADVIMLFTMMALTFATVR